MSFEEVGAAHVAGNGAHVLVARQLHIMLGGGHEAGLQAVAAAVGQAVGLLTRTTVIVTYYFGMCVWAKRAGRQASGFDQLALRL